MPEYIEKGMQLIIRENGLNMIGKITEIYK
jgi:hypothetical protein